ncbi:MAG TPA: hypothetical protein VHA75_05680, partial [Rugosimonospora sp.]|nr:hypothetical protein [Rugosimonospora sp.]
MVSPLHLAGVGLIAGSLVLFFGVYGLCLLATRPARPRPLPATQDLGPNPEPPAVVSLLANYWEITEDAAESTLLDLGARKYLEFRQPANDPFQTTVHVRVENPPNLNAYERRVFERVRGIAVGKVVPLTALTFRDPKAAAGFAKRIRAEVVADARARGLSRRRISRSMVAVLTVVAAVCAFGITAGAALLVNWTDSSDHGDDGKGILGLLFFAFAALTAIGARDIGERDTPQGREVAARWLGVKTWLQNTEAFGELPPSAVEVWDRYLAYGAAVGATRVSSAVIDMGMGNRKLVWSSFGNTWHRVRIRYPRVFWRYGKPAPPLVGRGIIALGIGLVLLFYWAKVIAKAAEQSFVENNPSAHFADPIKVIGLTVAVVLCLWGAYLIVRTVIDLAAPRTITGQVLWREVWRSTNSNNSSRPWLHYLAVDDGSADRTKAWALPTTLSGRCADGDTVKIVVRPWSRRIGEVEVLERGNLRTTDDSQSTSDQTEALILSAMGMPSQRGSTNRGGFLAGLVAGASGPAPQLVSEAEVSQAMATEVHQQSAPAVMGGHMIAYVDGRNQPVLVMGVMNGVPAQMLLRARQRATPLPGIGEEAYTGEGWAAARRGDTVIMLLTQGDGRRVPQGNLYWLLQTAVARL